MAAFGGIAASVLIGRLAKDIDPIKLMIAGYTGLGIVAFVFVNITAITTALWVFLLLFSLSGLPNITSQVGAATTASDSAHPRSSAGFRDSWRRPPPLVHCSACSSPAYSSTSSTSRRC